MWFSASRQLVSRKRWVIWQRLPLIATRIHYELSVGTTFNNLEWHLKVISAYVVILTSNISEIIYDKSTETKIANNKSHDSFHMIRLSMTLAIFQGLYRLFHIKFLVNGVWCGKSYYRLLIGNDTLAFDRCHFWWPWRTFEGHLRLSCHFYVQYLRNYTR